jgi:hypothetical protein
VQTTRKIRFKIKRCRGRIAKPEYGLATPQTPEDEEDGMDRGHWQRLKF